MQILRTVLEVDLIFSYSALLASGPSIADQLSTLSLSMNQQKFGNAAGVGREWSSLQPSHH